MKSELTFLFLIIYGVLLFILIKIDKNWNKQSYLLDRYICATYTVNMIKTFGNPETEKIWNGKKSPKLPPEIHKRAFAKLLIIHSAESEEDLKIPPGNKFEHLAGNLKDYCSIRINDQWRIQFKFQNNEAYEVQIVDYH